MKYTMYLVVTILLGSAAADVALAQEARNHVERIHDRQDVRQDVRELREDVLDVDMLQRTLERFDAARARTDSKALAAIDSDLRRRFAGEMAEARREVAKADREVRRSKRELRSDRREVRENRREDAPTAVRADDRRDRQDDRRDVRDDRRDAASERERKEELHRLAARFAELDGKLDPPSLDAKRQCMVGLLELARAEVAADARERREDHRELREDRRETREDRRQR